MSTNEPICTECDQPLVDGRCTVKQCSAYRSDAFGSLVPGEFISMDPTQIIDYTGTIGVNPGDVDSAMAHESVFPSGENGSDDDSAQTRLVDDDFYQQIQSIFPGESSSGSGVASGSARSDDESQQGNPDGAPSLSIRGVRGDYDSGEVLPPIRDILFPSDTSSLNKVQTTDPESIEGDEYRIVEKLGEGGYGVVFEAEQVALNRPVAVKVLKPKRKKPGSKGPSATGTGTGEVQRRRDQFLHEAKITARLQHPNIVPLYDFGINNRGQLFYSMKKVERRAWSSVLHDPAKLLGIGKDEVDATAEREAINKNVEIFDRVCDAMAYSHAMKVIHRDLKPDNIMIGDYGEVLLIDFGMALDFSVGQPEFSAGGTLVYMSPEMAVHFAKQKEIQVAAQKTAQRLGIEEGSVFLDKSNLLGVGKLAKELIEKSKDQGVLDLAETLLRLDSEEKELAAKIGYSSDIYLLGAILYQIAVGHPPHYYPLAACKQGRNEKFRNELWLAQKNGFQQYQQIHDPLRISLRNIAVNAMRTEPEKRYQTVEELQEAIKEFQLQVQSLEMTETGREELEKAKGGEGYQHLLPALESFRGATELWPQGKEANQLQVETACEYAGRAHQRKDFDAGLSILDEYVLGDDLKSDPVVQVRQKLVDGKRRRARARTIAAVGWCAAVVIPAVVYILGYLGNLNLQAERDRLTKDVELKAQQVAKANRLVDEADDKVEAANKLADKAEEDKLAAEKQTKIAEAITKAAKEKAEELEATGKQLETQIAGLNTNLKKLADDSDKLKGENQGLIAQQAELKTAVETAEKAEKAANEAAVESKRLADKFQFDADFGEFNSNVLTLPLDLRTGKNREAAEKLTRFENSNAKDHFKNGWLVRHYLKRANVAGVGKQVGENASVVDIVARPKSGDSIVVGTEAGAAAVWSMNSKGETKKLDIPLPGYGRIVDVAISPDDRLLALAVDDVDGEDVSQGHLWMINLNDTTQEPKVVVGPGVVGCQLVGFAPDGKKLVSVEELSGHRGLKERVQVAERTLDSGNVSDPKLTSVAATTRDEGRTRYLATVNWNQKQLLVALAYQTLDDQGSDIFRLESLRTGDAGELDSSGTIAESEFPTAVHVDQRNNMIIGYADGNLRRFSLGESGELNLLENRNESKIVRIASTPNGGLITGSENGVVIVWNPDHSFFKRIDGQPAELSALTIGKTDPTVGLTLYTGDVEGNVRYWQPETNLHDASIRKDSDGTVTCATIDQGLAAGAVPATAYGTKNGQVYFFNTTNMMARQGGQRLDRTGTDGNAQFRFRSPFESFGPAFNDFDSMGIIEDHFVLMKDDGTFFTSLIDTSRKNASPQTQTMDLGAGRQLGGRFVPLIASNRDQNRFFTTNPIADRQLLRWTKSGEKFERQSIELPSSSKGRIRRMAVSPNGNWLAIVRQFGNKRTTGEYVAEIYAVDESGDLTLAETTLKYRVGDPAFVGFSADNSKMVLHLHRSGIDRQTFIERRQFDGQKWNEILPRVEIDKNRKVDLIEWEDDADVERLITKFNNDYFLLSQTSPVSFQSEPFRVGTALGQEKLRTVRPTGNGTDYYVLSSNHLRLYSGTENSREADFATPISDARDLRVFGDQAVVLDKNGFHLVDSNLNYVTLLASRKVEVKDVALSSGRLAILYSNDLCRIWDVRGETPRGLGSFENASDVRLSPDGKWAAAVADGQLQVYAIDSEFEQPKLNLPNRFAAFQWTRKSDPRVLAVEDADGQLAWSSIDPDSGVIANRTDLPRKVAGFADFELAPTTERYVAIQTDASMELWVTGKNPIRLNQEEHEFDASRMVGLMSMSFSEVAQENEDAIGTRIVILSKDPLNNSDPEIRFFLLAQGDPETDENGELQPLKYRVVEIEGALEQSEGRMLLDTRFSGDGRSLLKVDERGTWTLLSQ